MNSERLTLFGMLTPEQRVQAMNDPLAQPMNDPSGPRQGTDVFTMTQDFHSAMGVESKDRPTCPSVSERLRRGSLILEEVLELFEAMGLELIAEPRAQTDVLKVTLYDSQGPTEGKLRLEHIEGSRYDVVETADALADINVVVNGTAGVFGIPIRECDYEVYCSNMSKLDENGKPIINGVTEGYRGGEDWTWCELPNEAGYQPDKPVGKILKPATYVPANIARVLFDLSEHHGW